MTLGILIGLVFGSTAGFWLGYFLREPWIDKYRKALTLSEYHRDKLAAELKEARK